MAAETSETDEGTGNRENGPQYPRELTINIDDLCLSVRARNVLINAGIKCVGDLVELSEAGLLRLPNCGRKTLWELREKLAELGLYFGMVFDQWDQRSQPFSITPAPLSDRTLLAALDENARAKLYLRVDEIGLSERARNVLKRGDIEFVGELVGNTERQLSRLPACGLLTLTEIDNKLAELGLRLGLSVSDWSAEAARRIRSQADSHLKSPRRKSLSILPSEFLEEELRAIVASVSNDRDTDIILKQLGWSGRGQRVLESVGQEYSLTRERVRQIVARKTGKIRKIHGETPRLDQALSVVRDCCPALAPELAAELCARSISKTDFDPTGLETACDVFQKEFGLERIWLGEAKVYVTPKQAKCALEFLRLCRRLTSSQGCANFDAVCDELRVPEAERQRFRKLAAIESMCEWLDPDQRWLFATGVPRNRLSNLVAKVLCVAPYVNLTDLRRAVARSRRLALVPPVGVLANFVERFKLASVVDGRASALSDFSGAIAPESAESILLEVLRKHGPLLRWDKFQELCMAAGMNPVTFGIYASGSPIIARVTRGVYSLVGADIPPGAVEDLEREVATSRAAEWGWSPRGTFWYALPITATAMAAGSVAVPQFVADIADGEWRVYLDGRQIDASVKCGNRFLWRLRRPLIKAGAQPGDVAILEFDLSKRTVNITLGGEELIDMWESGDIVLPLPEIGDEAGDDVGESSRND